MRLFDIGAKDGPQVVTNRVLTIPNLLSFARLFLLPVIYLDLVGERHVRALILLALMAATDWLDGYLARRLDQTSRLGILLDPISDRVLVLVVGIGFVVVGLLPLWAVLVVVVRDVAVMAIGVVLLLRGGQPPAVTRLGKASTFGLLFALPAFLVASVAGDGPLDPHPVVDAVAWAVFLVSAVLHWLSAFGYLRSVLGGRAGGSTGSDSG